MAHILSLLAAALATAASASASALRTSTSPALPSSSSFHTTLPAPTYSYGAGFLPAGNDLMNGSYSVSDAETFCTSQPSCAGFTFVNTSSSSPHPTAPASSGADPGFTFVNTSSSSTLPTAPASSGADPTFDVFFKTSAAGFTPTTGWSSYIKVLPKILSATFTDHAVLQHDNPCLWGYGNHSGASVSVTSSSDNVVHTGTVAADLTWRVCLSPQRLSASNYGPWEVNVTVQDTGSVVLRDILFGETWIASGQSNCAFGVRQSFNSSSECAAADAFGGMLRVMTVAQLSSNVTLSDFGPGGIRQVWAPASNAAVCGGGDFDYFSAVAFYFGRDLGLALQAQYGFTVPIGVIATTVPGTSIELWSSAEAMAQCNSTVDGDDGGSAQPTERVIPDMMRTWAEQRFAEKGLALGDSSGLYNAMVAPLLGVPIRGAIWYQGESNVGDANYACRFPALITDWRTKWTAGAGVPANFPFLFVQLSPYYSAVPPTCVDGGNGYADPGELPQQRIVQTIALSLPNVGMASAVDLGDAGSPYWPGSVHPRWKQPVGRRLANEALRIVYGQSSLITRGPQLASVAVVPDDMDHEGSYHSKDAVTLQLTFTSAGSSGLVVTNFAQVAFVGTYNDSSRVSATILPTNLTSNSLLVYLTPAFGAFVEPLPVTLDALWFDFPVVPVFSSPEGLPMEPFRVNLNSTALKSGRMGGGRVVEVWRKEGSA